MAARAGRTGAYADPLLPFPPGLRRDEHRGRDAERPLLELRDAPGSLLPVPRPAAAATGAAPGSAT